MAAFYDKGTYQAKIVKQSLGENSKGNPELQLTLQPTAVVLQNGELAEQPFPYERTIYLTFTDGTLGTEANPGWVLQTLAYLGFEGGSFADIEKHDFTGQEVTALCAHDNYQGKEREKWSILRPRTAAPVKPLDKKGLRTLDAKFGKALKAVVKQAKEAPPEKLTLPRDTTPVTAGVLPEAPAGRDSEDIPF